MNEGETGEKKIKGKKKVKKEKGQMETMNSRANKKF
jgi:hypothetical protein